MKYEFNMRDIRRHLYLENDVTVEVEYTIDSNDYNLGLPPETVVKDVKVFKESDGKREACDMTLAEFIKEHINVAEIG